MIAYLQLGYYNKVRIYIRNVYLGGIFNEDQKICNDYSCTSYYFYHDIQY